jgi:hypothetical protein
VGRKAAELKEWNGTGLAFHSEKPEKCARNKQVSFTHSELQTVRRLEIVLRPVTEKRKSEQKEG